MKESSYILAAKAIDGLRKKALVNGQTKTELASALHIARPTLNARFEAGDMMLSKFIQLSNEVGIKPSEALNCCDSKSCGFVGAGGLMQPVPGRVPPASPGSTTPEASAPSMAQDPCRQLPADGFGGGNHVGSMRGRSGL